MHPVDPHVFDGRDPWWREALEDLTTGEREQVHQAVRAGRPIDDPALEPFVYGSVARSRRVLRWRIALWPLQVGLSALWAYFTWRAGWLGWRWVWLAILILTIVAIPASAVITRRRLARADPAIGGEPQDRNRSSKNP